MATNYPGSLDSGTQQPSPSSSTEMDDSGFEHDVVHTNHSGAIIALETKVGTGDSNAVASSVLAGTGSGTSAWTTGALANDISGNAATATALETARTINGTSFNGTANITVTAAADTLTGSTLNSGVTASSLTSVGTLTSLTTSGSVDGPQDFTVGNGEGEFVLFQGSSNQVFVQTNGTYRAYFNTDGHFLPYADSTYDIGGSSIRWSVIYGDRSRNGNGTVSSPAFSFANDTNTGIYRQAADALGITTGGTERVRIGSFGIRGDDSGDVYNFDAFKGNNGSASAPTFSFDSDTDTGMYRSGTNEISFSAGNDTAFTISSGGVFVPSGEDYFGVPTTGTGNDAEWASTGFGTYMLKRNSSLAAEKENITADLGTHLTADMIDSVVPKMWNRLNSPGYPEIGPLADDMDVISPFLATKGADFEGEELGDSFLTGINKTAYLSLLVLAVKDLRGRVAGLEAA